MSRVVTLSHSTLGRSTCRTYIHSSAHLSKASFLLLIVRFFRNTVSIPSKNCLDDQKTISYLNVLTCEYGFLIVTQERTLNRCCEPSILIGNDALTHP